LADKKGGSTMFSQIVFPGFLEPVGDGPIDKELRRIYYSIKIPTNQEFHFVVDIAYHIWNHFVSSCETDWISFIKIGCFFKNSGDLPRNDNLKDIIKNRLYFGLSISLAPPASMDPVCKLKLRSNEVKIIYETGKEPKQSVFEVNPVYNRVSLVQIGEEIINFLRGKIYEAQKKL
jgi:hypothetical protein